MRAGFPGVMSAALPRGSLFQPMGNIVASCVVDIDATIADSFSSGQTWLNIEPTPADSSSQTANDFFMGATGSAAGDDPTFTGTAGDSAAYMLYDGGDRNGFKGGVTTFFDSLHKTTGGSDWTIFIPFYFIPDTTKILFGTSSPGSQVGIIIWFDSTVNYVITTQYGTGPGISVASGVVLNSNAPNMIGIAHDHSTDTTKIWTNSSTAATESHVYETTTAAAGAKPDIGSWAGSSFVPNGTRIYGFSAYNEYLSDTQALAIMDEYSSRHNRAYT